MFDDEDFGFLTGGLGDLDGDGKVDFTEYIFEEDDFEQIMGNNDDDDYSVSSDDDDDWELDNLDIASEYGLDVYDYADKEEFLEALEEAKENTHVGNDENEADIEKYDEEDDEDDDEEEDEEEYDEEDEDVDEEEDVIPFKDFDISKLSLTIGANTSLNYDGKPIDEVFGNGKTKNLQHDDEYFGKSDTAEDISPEEYKKLKNENKALKSKITQLENRITDLNYNIQRLEADIDALRKPKPKKWDGKYYRYCRVEIDDSATGLWYRTDDITLKKGDFVYVPYGYKNEEELAKVLLVEEFRSDDLPFPLEKTKFICSKCT